MSWILYKMVCAISFWKSYLCIQPSLQSPPKICYPTSASFHIPIQTLLAHKIIFTIPTNTPFLYTPAIFHLPCFTYSHPYNLHQKYFPYLSHLAKSGSVKGPMSKGVLWELTLFQPTLFWSLTSSSKYRQG